MYSFNRRTTLFGGGAIVLVVLIVVGIIVGSAMFSNNTRETITITVEDKERVANRDDDGARYMVWAEVHNADGSTSSETFEVTDSLFQGKFRAADTYGALKRGGTYRVEVNGWRNGFFSSNRNILEILQVVQVPDDDNAKNGES